MADRIPIPEESPEKLLALAAAVVAKHEELGDASPLNQLKVGDKPFAEIAATVAAAQTDHDDAKAAEKLAEQKHGDRNAKLPNILKLVRQSRDLLTVLNPENRKALGEWGYTVDG